MKHKISFSFIIVFLISAYTFCFSQVIDTQKSRELDLCKDFSAIKYIQYPFNISNISLAEKARFNPEALRLIRNATVFKIPQNEDYSCIDDSVIYQNDFDSLEIYPFHILNVMGKERSIFIVKSTNSRHTYLLTYISNSAYSNCIEIKNAVLLSFTCGNMHWHYGRTAIIYSEDRIEISERSWHESDELPETPNVVATLSINKDGSIQIKRE